MILRNTLILMKISPQLNHQILLIQVQERGKVSHQKANLFSLIFLQKRSKQVTRLV